MSSSTFENLTEYREYKTNMNKFISKLDEILYRFDMVDIDRLEQFLINLIETNKISINKYDADKISLYVSELIKNPKYKEMISYISTNSNDIETLLKNLNNLFDDNIKKYIKTDISISISEDLYKQKQDINEKIDKIVKASEKRNEPEKFEALPFEKLNYYRISNEDNISMDEVLVKFGFIDNIEQSAGLNVNDEEKTSMFYQIYIKLHENFKADLNALKINTDDIKIGNFKIILEPTQQTAKPSDKTP